MEIGLAFSTLLSSGLPALATIIEQFNCSHQKALGAADAPRARVFEQAL